jgi:hypothetical protein
MDRVESGHAPIKVLSAPELAVPVEAELRGADDGLLLRRQGSVPASTPALPSVLSEEH